MTSHPKLHMVPHTLVSVVIVAMIGWFPYAQRWAASATSIHGTRVQEGTLYTGTTKNDFIYTAPAEGELCGRCASQLRLTEVRAPSAASLE